MKVAVLTALCFAFTSTVLHAKGLDFLSKKTYQHHIEARDYDKALATLLSIKEEKRTVPQRQLIHKLRLFEEIEKEAPARNNMLISAEDIDLQTREKALRFYRKAQSQLLESKSDIARDILIHITHIYPKHPKASLLLEKAFELKMGDYKSEDIIQRNFQRSEHYFLGGNFYLALKDLEVLSIIDSNNPVVFERLGSNYYKINKKKKAIDNWAKAQFIDPKKTYLDGYIEMAKIELAEQQSQIQKKKKEEKKKDDTIQIKDPIQWTFAKESQALDFAHNYRKQKLKVLVSQREDGKWVVKVSKAELEALNKKKKK